MYGSRDITVLNFVSYKIIEGNRLRNYNIHHILLIYIYIITVFICGPGSSVGIATELRAGRSGIESWWGRDFPSRPALGPTQSTVKWVPGISRG